MSSSPKMGVSTPPGNDIPISHHHIINNDTNIKNMMDRRQLFRTTMATVSSSLLCQTPIVSLPAHAGGLLQFPVTKSLPLKNKYHLMRAGMSELEHQGIYSTNPLFLTNRENQMHIRGQQQIKRAVEKMLPSSQLPTVVYHSLAANGMDTGDLIARELNLGRDRLLPEFTYLDQRGIGLWDSSDMSIVQPALWALDEMEAGVEGFGGRPPANEDGTPNETLHDQFIRLRQFLSLQESRTSGETILIVFPDGTGPALLCCMIAGIPFNKVHVLEMVPGELRLDVTPESIKVWYEQHRDDPDYLATIEDGKEKLVMLRQKQKDNTLQQWISLKDSIAEQEQQNMDRLLKEKKAAERRQQEESNAQALAQAKQKADNERQRQAEKRNQQERERQAVQAKRKVEQATVTNNVSTKGGPVTTTNTDSSTSSPVSFGALASTGGLGLLGLGILAIGTTNNNDKNGIYNNNTVLVQMPVNEQAIVNATNLMQPISVSAVVAPQDSAAYKKSDTSNAKKPKVGKSFDDGDDHDRLMLEALPTLTKKAQDAVIASDKTMIVDTVMDVLSRNATERKREFNCKMERAQKQLKDVLTEAVQVQNQKKKTSMYENGNIFSTVTPLNPTQTENYRHFPKPYTDDGANDWLKVLAEIRDEQEDEMDETMDYHTTSQQDDDVLVYGEQRYNNIIDNFQNGTTTTVSTVRNI